MDGRVLIDRCGVIIGDGELAAGTAGGAGAFDESAVLEDAVEEGFGEVVVVEDGCLLYTSPSPRDATLSRMPSSA